MNPVTKELLWDPRLTMACTGVFPTSNIFGTEGADRGFPYSRIIESRSDLQATTSDTDIEEYYEAQLPALVEQQQSTKSEEQINQKGEQKKPGPPEGIIEQLRDQM